MISSLLNCAASVCLCHIQTRYSLIQMTICAIVQINSLETVLVLAQTVAMIQCKVCVTVLNTMTCAVVVFLRTHVALADTMTTWQTLYTHVFLLAPFVVCARRNYAALMKMKRSSVAAYKVTYLVASVCFVFETVDKNPKNQQYFPHFLPQMYDRKMLSSHPCNIAAV